MELIWQDKVTISNGLRNILEKMTYDNFNQRYHSAIEALEALQNLQPINLSSLPPTTPIFPPSSLKKQPKPPLVLISVIIIFLICIIAIVVIKNNSFNPQNEPTPSQREFDGFNV